MTYQRGVGTGSGKTQEVILSGDIVSASGLIVAAGANSNRGLEIARGNITGHSWVNKFGFNDDIDIGSVPEDVWSNGGLWVAPTTARLHDLASTSGSDTAAGAGAQTVSVFGLDSAGLLQNETVTMAGVANATTANTYTMIHRMTVDKSGTAGTNVGVISATAQTDATVTAVIDTSVTSGLGRGQTLMSIYKIPADKTGWLWGHQWWLINDKLEVECSIVKELANGTEQVKWVGGVIGDGTTSPPPVAYTVPVQFEAGSIIKARVDFCTANNSRIANTFALELIDD